MKKLLAILLALVMTLSLCVTVFADTTPAYSITVNNPNPSISIVGNTYYAYKLFDVTYADVDSTVDGPDAYAYTIKTDNPFYTNASAKAVLDTYFTFTASAGDPTIMTVSLKKNASDEEIINLEGNIRVLADALQPYLPTTADGSATAIKDSNDKEVAVIELDEAGYYLVAGVVDAIHADQTGDNPKVTSAIAVTTTNPTPEFNIKADAPDIDKFIVNADSDADENPADTDTLGKGTAVNVGDTVTFNIPSKVPTMEGYDVYKFIVHDTLSTGLTFTPGTVKVKIGGTELGANAFSVSTSCTDGCSIEVMIPDLLATDATTGARLYADGAAIEITFDAVLNDGALKTAYETNTVLLEYSSNPYNANDTKKTPEHKVYVYDFDIEIDKFAKINDNEIKLKDASFVLYKNVIEEVEDDTTTTGTKEVTVKYYYKYVEGTNGASGKVTWYKLAANETVKAAVTAGYITQVTTDENGYATFVGLDSGEYYLTETEAPKGFNLLTEDVVAKIEATYNGTTGALVSTDSKTTLVQKTEGEDENKTVVEEQYKHGESVENKTGAILPATGGIGTTIFYIVGAILVVAAGVLLITKKRMSSKG